MISTRKNFSEAVKKYRNSSYLKYLIKNENQWSTFLINLEALIEEYDVVNISLMGFPENWHNLLLKDI
ncbi:MAG: hypothetical protein PWP31_1452 [Clostridia bacterium]|nr:hypothetical protein [Clostridia bacterium]